MQEISLEDLAMGKLPKKDNKGNKTEPMSDSVKAKIKKVATIVDNIDGMSVKSLKKYNKTELKAMLKAYDKTQDALYRAKEMIREALPKDKMGMGMAIEIGC